MNAWTIARLSLLELWRQKIPWGFIAVGVVLLAPAFIPLGHMVVNGEAPLALPMRDGLLSFTQFAAILLTATISSNLIPAELERGTLLLLVTKPLSRPTVIVGKWLAAASWMLAAWVLWGLITALALSVQFGGGLFVSTLEAFVASVGLSWLVAALCLCLSCMLPANATMGLAIIAWLVASGAPRMADAATTLGHPGWARVLVAIGWLLPVNQLAELAGRLAHGEAPALSNYLALLLVVAWTGGAAAIFGSRDLAQA